MNKKKWKKNNWKKIDEAMYELEDAGVLTVNRMFVEEGIIWNLERKLIGKKN